MDAATSCSDIRSLFYSQARAAALLGERSSMAEQQINTDRLATLMAAFENGEVFRPNPFDVEDPLEFGTSKAAQMCAAFARLAREDTPYIHDPDSGPPATPHEVEVERKREAHDTALIVAGLLQGMWIGYEYAHRDVYGDES